ncbi:MAG TPA: hypothetical protein VNX28_07495 [Gemmataceae bacterium]|jgi:hypothetical protein|nr:hypothetical protein [Gemmataceae bacterium]
MNRLILRLISTGMIALALGCSRSTPTAAPTSYSYEVRGEEGSVTLGTGEVINANAGKNRLGINGGRVTANGKSYGLLKNGDGVLLDRDGQLSVNGQKRQPE